MDKDPWESVLLGIILDIAETVPKPIEAPELLEKWNHPILVNGGEFNEKSDLSEKVPVHKPSVKFTINIKKEDVGKPSDSHFVYNHFDGTPLFKSEKPEG